MICCRFILVLELVIMTCQSSVIPPSPCHAHAHGHATCRQVDVSAAMNQNFNKLVLEAKQLASDGRIADALKLNRLALKIRHSEKLAKRIDKMKVCVCMCACVQRACVRACMHACVRACVHVCVVQRSFPTTFNFEEFSDFLCTDL